MEDGYAIGLDLGTTFSCIGVYRNGGVEIIPNSMGERITPSVVIFNNDETLVGEDTIDFLVKHYDNCIYEVKRLIGLDFTDKEKKYEDEIKKLPFKIVNSTKKNLVDIEITKNGVKEFISPVEISSLIIKKMVDNAEAYLNKRIKKLVITVPAYFEEPQKKLTRQAAEMLDLEVIKIINEPTAAALAYGFTNEKIGNKKILVFDLGGGTFDVSILALEIVKNKDNTETKNLIALSIDGNMHLGGEDFDNALVDYVIKKQNISDEIAKNPEARKKLKVACENTKKILSIANNTTLRISNFAKDLDINIEIKREEFEQICQHLFKKLEEPMNVALSKAKLSKDDIDEVILIGGSTRIPKIKDLIKEFFKNKIKINDSINPDEAVAFGATLQAEKILYNQDQIISNFHILDITPFSLGVSVMNQSMDKEIKEEGDEMSVIIKRGTILPTFNIQHYVTVSDYQTRVSLKIYEGEKKYVKYNHLLKETKIEGLSPKPKGQTKISVEFKIDVNGILFVKAVEESEKDGKTIDLSIKNDEISFSDEEMNERKKKMEEMIKKIKHKHNEFDYSNFKETLKNYKDAYNECGEGEEEDKKLILNNYNEALEEFIDGFTKNYKFDNETLLEKFYLYVKELFLSYIDYLKLSSDKGERTNIFKKIEKYITTFIDKSSGYLNNLLEILSPLQNGTSKLDFLNLILFVMERLNQCGKDCLQKNKEFCKYHSLMYFEQAYSYYERYFSNIKVATLGKQILDKLNKEKETCINYKNDINSGAIIFVEDSLNKGQLFDENVISYNPHKAGFTINYIKLGFAKVENYTKKTEIITLILREYEKLLASIQISNKPTEKEAICIANILKIYTIILANLDSRKKYLFALADRCKLIIEQLKISDSRPWCKEFLNIYEKIQKLKTKNDNYFQILEKVRANNPEFDELDSTFNKTHGKIEFINYLIEKHPYKELENDKKTRDFNTYSPELLIFLMKKYQPDNYVKVSDEYDKKFCLYHEISSKLSNMLTTIN